MDPVLSVPELISSEPGEIDTSPSRIREWLAKLPLLNINETSHQLHKRLMQINRISMPAEQREEILELFRETVSMVTEKLEKRYAGKPLPLSEDDTLTAEMVRHFQMEMAHGYKRIVNEQYPHFKPKLTGKHAQALVIPVHRAIRYLTEVLVHSYQFYSPYPAGLWSELHQLFLLANHHEILTRGVADPINKSLAETSIANAYKQALLLDLSDPYHLPSAMIGKISNFLDRWAPLARITNSTVTTSASCQFLVDVKSDRAGHILVSSEEENGETGMRFLLTTVDLAREIHNQLSEYREGRKPEPNGLHPDFYDSLAHEMLLRLINSWGVNPKRIFRRNPIEGRKMDVAIGLADIRFFMNGNHHFMTSAEYMGPKPQRTKIGTFFTRIDEHEEALDNGDILVEEGNEEHEYATWDVIDESAGGLALGKTGSMGLKIRVGDLITIRNAGGGKTWALAVVRWMKCVGPERMEIGIQRLSAKAQPIAVKTLDMDNKESDFLPALLVPEITALNQPATMITPRGLYKPQRIIYMDDSRRLHRVVSSQLVEITGAFERFQYKEVSI